MISRSLSVPDKYHHNISCLDRTENKDNDKSRICIGKTRGIHQKIGPAIKAWDIMTVNNPDEMN